MVKSKTVKRKSSTKRSSKQSKSFNVIHFLLHLLNVVKLHHWKTSSYPTHKATDELYGELNALIDNFVEVLLGKSGVSRSILTIKPINAEIQTNSQLIKYIEKCKQTLQKLTTLSNVISESDNDLLNIKDEILAALNKFTYLLTLK